MEPCPGEGTFAMKKNVGRYDRVFRALGGTMMVACSILAPLPLVARVAGLGMMGAYLLYTAVAGSCVGYHLMGKSTCPLETPR
jgi:Protein of unknown function (DUF2892)